MNVIITINCIFWIRFHKSLLHQLEKKRRISTRIRNRWRRRHKMNEGNWDLKKELQWSNERILFRETSDKLSWLSHYWRRCLGWCVFNGNRRTFLYYSLHSVCYKVLKRIVRIYITVCFKSIICFISMLFFFWCEIMDSFSLLFKDHKQGK